MDSNRYEIVLVLDRSGSMGAIRTDMIGAVNTFMDGQRVAPGSTGCRVTACQFDDVYEPLFADTPIKDVPPLTLETYVPRGCTALLDAVGRTIEETGARLAKTEEEKRPSRVFFVIVTDGHENASTRFTRQQVYDMVKLQRDTYKWDFVFLGVGIDAFDAAAQMSVPQASTSPVTSTPANIAAMAYATSDAVTTAHKSGKAYSYTTAHRASMTTPQPPSPRPLVSPPPMPTHPSSVEKKWAPIS